MDLKGYIAVGQGHEIYYELFGDRSGIPVFFLHGGPGLGFSESDKRFFNPKEHFVVFFDQRGSGKSRPLGGLKHNTAQHLLDDIGKLIDHFSLDKIVLFGGSWGSTLALLFAIKYPQKVRSLVLRGVFLASLKSRAFFEFGGTAAFFPKAWKRFQDLVPVEFQDQVFEYYLDQILSSDQELSQKYAYELSRYGMSVSRLHISEVNIDQVLGQTDFESSTKILAHYSKNNFFLPDNFILDHCSSIGRIPVNIIHGRYDVICLPQDAYELSLRLKNAHLFFVLAGHASGEKEIEELLKSRLEDV